MVFVSKLKKIVSNKYNILFFMIFLFAFIIRLKYFNMNSAIWWDEAEYLSMAKHWSHSIPFEIHFVRPVLFPFIASIFFKIGLGEFSLRVFELFTSMVTILLTYLIGIQLYNKKIGLIAAFLSSISYLYLFYTARLMTELPSLTLWLLSFYLFWRGYVQKKSKYNLWLMGVAVGLSILMRFPTAIIAVVFLCYVLLKEGLKFIKNKDLWISVVISVLVMLPYFIWYYFRFGGIGILEPSQYFEHSFLFIDYLKLLPAHYLFSPIFGNFHAFMLFFIIGVLTIFSDLIFGYGNIRRIKKLRRHFVVVLLFFVPYAYFSTAWGVEPRYFIYSLPAVFYIVAIGTLIFYNFLKKYNKHVAISLILVLFVLGSYQHLTLTNNSIISKKDSYLPVKEAALWMKEHSNERDIIYTSSHPQVAYYSERETYKFPEDKFDQMGMYHTLGEPYSMNGRDDDQEFVYQINKLKPKFFMISNFQKSPEYAYNFPEVHSEMVELVTQITNSDSLLINIYGFVYD
ncbi:hypothetical protein HOA59_02145 [archaeon]|jgi:4-amino-4-deoxy-L-arabinose transferase-like glycosyltransferase|nr:hypothetical protein [archaeon]MBT6824216.1 hypothetical protein [archaeon]MBT7106754.1 hypothetical protein [archaeon]MBT7297552.1 hypothetical protein [archaeon]